MGKLVRKNLILDSDELRALAETLGTSESAAVREVVAAALQHRRAVAEAAAALEAIEARGGFDADWEDLAADRAH